MVGPQRSGETAMMGSSHRRIRSRTFRGLVQVARTQQHATATHHASGTYPDGSCEHCRPARFTPVSIYHVFLLLFVCRLIISPAVVDVRC
jgi:hypothetical protein